MHFVSLTLLGIYWEDRPPATWECMCAEVFTAALAVTSKHWTTYPPCRGQVEKSPQPGAVSRARGRANAEDAESGYNRRRLISTCCSHSMRCFMGTSWAPDVLRPSGWLGECTLKASVKTWRLWGAATHPTRPCKLSYFSNLPSPNLEWLPLVCRTSSRVHQGAFPGCELPWLAQLEG